MEEVVNKKPQMGSGVLVDGERTQAVKSKAVRASLKTSWIRREGKDKRAEKREMGAVRAWLRELFGAVAIHEIVPRSRSKFALDYPQNLFPCPSDEFHEVMQNEKMEKQTARQCDLVLRVLTMLHGKSISFEGTIDAWHKLREEDRDATYFYKD